MPSYISAIYAFAFDFAPYSGDFAPYPDYVACDGRLLLMTEYAPLYQVIGTTYGGDGITTFAVPDLRGRVPIGAGQGPGLSNYTLGQQGGEESTMLNINHLPPHTHTVASAQLPVGGLANTPAPGFAYFAGSNPNTGPSYSPGPPDVTMAPNSTYSTGGTNKLNIVNPYRVLSYYMCAYGIVPTQS